MLETYELFSVCVCVWMWGWGWGGGTSLHMYAYATAYVWIGEDNLLELVHSFQQVSPRINLISLGSGAPPAEPSLLL